MNKVTEEEYYEQLREELEVHLNCTFGITHTEIVELSFMSFNELVKFTQQVIERQ